MNCNGSYHHLIFDEEKKVIQPWSIGRKIAADPTDKMCLFFGVILCAPLSSHAPQ